MTKVQNESAIKFSAEKYLITGSELEEILKNYGLSQRKFGEAIEKSAATVNRMIFDSGNIKIVYAQILESIIGKDIYLMLLTQMRDRRKRLFEQRVKSREIYLEAERLKKEKKLNSRLKKKIDAIPEYISTDYNGRQTRNDD